MKGYFINNKYVGIYPTTKDGIKAEKRLINESDISLFKKGCEIGVNNEVVETPEYTENLLLKGKQAIQQSIKDNKYQYEIDSVLLEMVKAIYDVIPVTMQDAIPIEIKTKYNQLKTFIDSKII